MSEPSLDKDQVRAWSRELGFEAVGFAPAEEPPDARDRLQSWLDRGYHASMAWMAREPVRRVDPERILEGARSVIVTALVYDRPEPVPAAPALPRIARYARGDDYHEVVGEKLHALADRIRAHHPEARVRIACDTSAILEKAFGVAAGLGWLGKNTCLLHPKLGSWFFLGEIFTTLAVSADPAVTDLCGSCRRCLDVCPTDAFPQPYVLDANRCLSYRNIEHRGAFPTGWGESLGDWLVGCDLCQDVCPWNRKAPFSPEERFAPRPELTRTTAEEWESLDDAGYRARVKGTAITRIKAADMRRNAGAVRENRSRASADADGMSPPRSEPGDG
ncbi:MAG: tRNA epoxyqueuosine(34) reductase QueG [Candidatus Eisenbacteria bacterium]|uniref:Epoxyqueuosine reductase n=1 Tax=Eiseniibacteriota bacterium TaxID=2212470 RepID=A0A956M282_UNCEI|nr:tRNA epoxyqueuosine(34) reductase QueG [Candidatus Eisenbacteria bacterium]